MIKFNSLPEVNSIDVDRSLSSQLEAMIMTNIQEKELYKLLQFLFLNNSEKNKEILFFMAF